MNREITDKNLHLLLPGKVSLFAKIYAEEKGVTLLDAIRIFYRSNTYKALEKEETKLLDWFNENHSEISREINTTKKLDDNLKTRIITLAKQYRGQE